MSSGDHNYLLLHVLRGHQACGKIVGVPSDIYSFSWMINKDMIDPRSADRERKREKNKTKRVMSVVMAFLHRHARMHTLLSNNALTNE